MAKAKDLAGIAALGALGYMLSKGKGDSSKTDTGDETERLAKRGESRRQITDYMKKAPEAKDANYGNEGRRTSMGVSSAPKTTTKAAPKLETITTRKDPREAEAGMSRGTRTTSTAGAGRGSVNPPSVSATDARSAESGMSRGTRTTSMAGAGRGLVNPPVSKPTDPRSAEAGTSRGTRTTSMAGAGRGSVNPPSVSATDPRSAESGMSRGTRTTSMAGAGRGSVNPPNVSATDPRSAEAGTSRGTRTTVPPFKGGQKGYDEAGNFMGGQRGYDEAGNPMKKGGKVKTKKMASGGMTASRRADGIASRGKTKCKMY